MLRILTVRMWFLTKCNNSRHVIHANLSCISAVSDDETRNGNVELYWYLELSGPTLFSSKDELADKAVSGMAPEDIPKSSRQSPITPNKFRYLYHVLAGQHPPVFSLHNSLYARGQCNNISQELYFIVFHVQINQNNGLALLWQRKLISWIKDGCLVHPTWSS